TVATTPVTPRNATTLAAAGAAGDTVIKVASVANMVAGEKILVDTGANQEFGSIRSVGTAGAAGTGVTLGGPIATPHAAGASARNGIYPANSAAWARIQNNLANEVAFRNATADSVSQAFQVLGQKYNFSMPLENPLRLDQVGSTPVDPTTQTVPAYTAAD